MAGNPRLSPEPSRGRRREFLHFSRPTLEEEEIDEVVECLRSGWITSGPRVVRFEEMFRERLGCKHAVAVGSATAGLHITLAALDIGPGDEVIVPSLTWASTANVVELCGARTVFADVDEETLCLDPEDAASRVTPRTRAIIPVHFAGQPVDLDALRALASERGIHLVEDAAHALGTRYRGVEIGAEGEAVVFSFHPIKNITTGEGGMIICRDDDLAARLRLLRFHGVSKDAWSRYHEGSTAAYEVVEPGWKYNMMDIQAALGIRQLQKLDRFNERRRVLAERYARRLEGIPGIRPLGAVPYPATHSWHLYVVRTTEGAGPSRRDRLMEELRAENIGTGLHFPVLHLQRHYRERYGHRRGDLPRSEAASDRILSLPLYPLLGEEDQGDVISALGRILGSGMGGGM